MPSFYWTWQAGAGQVSNSISFTYLLYNFTLSKWVRIATGLSLISNIPLSLILSFEFWKQFNDRIEIIIQIR